MTDNACETPLLDLLKSVPSDARLIYEHSPIESSFIPVGVLAKKAADALEAQAREIEALKAQLVHQAKSWGREREIDQETIEALRADAERRAAVVAAAIEALEWHASKYCEDSMPQDTVDALAMLRKDSALLDAALQASGKAVTL